VTLDIQGKIGNGITALKLRILISISINSRKENELTKGILQLSAPGFLGIFRTARYRKGKIP